MSEPITLYRIMQREKADGTAPGVLLDVAFRIEPVTFKGRAWCKPHNSPMTGAGKVCHILIGTVAQDLGDCVPEPGPRLVEES